MTRYFLLLLSLFLSHTMHAQLTFNTFQAYADYAIKNNPDIKRAAINELIERQNYYSSIGAVLPVVRASSLAKAVFQYFVVASRSRAVSGWAGFCSICRTVRKQKELASQSRSFSWSRLRGALSAISMMSLIVTRPCADHSA